MSFAAIVLAVTVTFSPSQPTVGDVVTVEFPQPVTVDPSPAYEVVNVTGRRVQVRTFEPKPMVLRGSFGAVSIPVRSVLEPQDDMKPAPLRPPLEIPYARAPFVFIGVAALCAAAIWALVIFLAKRAARGTFIAPPLLPGDRYRAAVASLRTHPQRWAALADELRIYLGARRPDLGAELTTTQLLPRLHPEVAAPVSEILRQGDLEKFSPWGAGSADFEKLAEQSLIVLTWLEPMPVEEGVEAA